MNSACRVMFMMDQQQVAEIKEWCKERSINFSEFIRKGVTELWERVCNR